MDKQFLNPINILVIVIILLTGINASYAESLPSLAPNINLPAANKPLITPQPPKTKAKAYMLVDAKSGKVIASKAADKRYPPASLTKMMTLYIASNALKSGRLNLDDKVLVSEKAWRTGGSRMFIKEGQSVSVKDLLKGIIVQSGNDATVALAEHIAGSEQTFVDLMNQQAQALGMKNTHFTDSTGMPDKNHYSTARDLTILSRALIQNFPEYYAWYKQKWFSYNGIKQSNRNRLLWSDNEVDGIKTGHTDEAGYCLAASAVEGDMRLIAIVIGTPSDSARTASTKSLLKYGFRFFKTHKLYEVGQTLAEPRVWQGANNTVPVGLDHDLYVTIPRGQYKNLKATLLLPKTLKAPLAKNQILGSVALSLNGKKLFSKPLIALKANPKGGLWTRVKDSISLTVHSWFNSDKKA